MSMFIANVNWLVELSESLPVVAIVAGD